LGGFVFAIVDNVVGVLAGRYACDLDGKADGIGGALLAFRSYGH
jgi:hypothetical protein